MTVCVTIFAYLLLVIEKKEDSVIHVHINHIFFLKFFIHTHVHALNLAIIEEKYPHVLIYFSGRNHYPYETPRVRSILLSKTTRWSWPFFRLLISLKKRALYENIGNQRLKKILDFFKLNISIRPKKIGINLTGENIGKHYYYPCLSLFSYLVK